MAGNSQVEIILGKAGLRPPEPISHLQPPQAPIFHGLLSNTEYKSAARSLLVEQRTSDPNYRPPWQQKRHRFRTQKQKDAVCQEENWVFTKHEIARAFDSLVSRKPQASVGVLRALTADAPSLSLQELWRHLQDPKLKKKQKQKRGGIDTTSFNSSGLSWLEKATHLGHLDHITFLCQTQLAQDVLDRAFGVALSARAMGSMKLLLSFGAAASVYRDAIRVYVGARDIALVRLLLSATGSMDTESWQHCIGPEFASPKPPGEGFINILMCCCAYRPDIISKTWFLGALESQNLEATAIMLAYASATSEVFSECDAACERAARVQNHERRLTFFSLLAEAGIIADSPACREELARDTEGSHIELVRLLVAAGVAVDFSPHHPFYKAVARLDYNMLSALQDGHFTASVSAALNHVPADISERDILRLINILGPMGVTGTILDSYLPRAVSAKNGELIERLLYYGASVEFDSAAAIRTALRKADFDILSILLQEDCLPHILSAAVPMAMALPSRPNRLRAVKALLEKGVRRQKLRPCVRLLASENGELDAELIRILIEYRAPLDDGALFEAVVRAGHRELLMVICDAGLGGETLALGVVAAFGAMESLAYDAVLDMINLLLQKGASGPLVDQTLFRAIMGDERLDIVRALLHHGADANHAEGAPYIFAVKRRNLQLLELLHAGCAPNQVNLERLFFTAVEPAYYDSEMLECILQSAASSAGTRGVSWDINRLINHRNLSEIVTRLIQHGLYADKWSETLLLLAIRATDVNLLAKILREGPSYEARSAAFKEARRVKSRELRLELMSLLLAKGASFENHEIGQSQILPQETKAALDGDFTGLLLLLSHQASVDFDQGRALRMASTAGSFEVVDMLLSAGADPETVVGAFAETISADMTLNTRHDIFCRLLKANPEIPAVWTSKALSCTVLTDPGYTELSQLLVAHGAKADSSLLQLAMRLCSKEVFETLTSSIVNPNIATRAFKQARHTKMDAFRRYWAYSALLGKGVGAYEVSEALTDSLLDNPHNWDIPKLLLEHDAEVGHHQAVSFKIALRTGDLHAFRLLCQYIVDDDTANLAFQLVKKHKTLGQDDCHEAYSCLLQWPITQPQLHAALVDSIKQSRGTINKTIRLLLHSGANPNSDNASCFVLACHPSHEEVFRALCQYADLEVVLPILMDHIQLATQATVWIRECLIETPGGPREIKHNGLLFQCMRKFPENIELLEMLLDYGVPAFTKVDTSLRKGWPVEPCTALLWAMFSHPRIDNSIIECLLARGGQVCVKYSTPKTNISAVFGCLMDKSRTPLLKDVLRHGGSDVLNLTISGSTFMDLALNSDSRSTKEFSVLFGEEDEISPTEASLFLGNFEAFRLLGGGETPDDGSLHIAALLALPKFALWLVKEHGHDPNYAEESFGFMVPLGVACSSKPFPWCEIANEEEHWRERLNETMRLLAPQTDTSWRLVRKTPLHIALENGPEVTEAMAAALNISHDLNRYEKYLYHDRTGKIYTPVQYIENIMDAPEGEKSRLIMCLERHKLVGKVSVP